MKNPSTTADQFCDRIIHRKYLSVPGKIIAKTTSIKGISIKLPFVLFCLAMVTVTQSFSQKNNNVQPGPFFLRMDAAKERHAPEQAETLVREMLGLSAHDELRLIGSETDRNGNVHQRYQHYYKGVKVEYGIIIVHTRNGVVSSVSGEFYPTNGIKAEAKLSKQAALDIAKKHIGAKKYMWESAEQEALLKKLTKDKQATYYPAGELVVIKNRVAWRFNIYASEPESNDIVYIDGNDSALLEKQSLICEDQGTANTRYSGSQNINTYYDAATSQYKLADYSRGQGIEVFNLNNTTLPSTTITEFTNSTNDWDWTVDDDAAVDAFWGTEMVYDYWKNVHGRNSYNNSGAKINVWVHYSVTNTASWDGVRLRLGDGQSGAKATLDIVAHELGHAVKDFTAQLGKYYEPGALNEGFSDIWAACTENYINDSLGLSKDIWLFEEELYPAGSGLALRSLVNPKQFNHPDTYLGQYWIDINDNFPIGAIPDNGGIHTNCTVLGHWFYILSEGKQGTNDTGFNYNVAGITIDNAEQLVYQAERFYVTSNSGYYHTRYATILAAEDVFGVNSAEAQAVKDSWDAVGVYDILANAPTYCTPSISPSGSWLTNVKITTLLGENKLYQHDNASLGYTNYIYQGFVANVHANQQYIFDIRGKALSNNYYKVWIDYNKDGVFQEPGELVVNAGPLGNFTDTVQIDPLAPLGFTRMRVAIKSGSSPDSPCSISGLDEVEDYGLNIQPPCAPVSSVQVAQLTSNSASLIISGSGSDYQIKLGETNGDPNDQLQWPTIQVNSSNPTISLSPFKAYLIKVRAVCSANSFSDWSLLQILDTVNYCLPNLPQGQPTYSSAWMTPANGRAINLYGYQDFTKSGNITYVTAGNPMSFPIYGAGQGTSNPYYYHVWIDFNNDGDFLAGELMYQSPPSIATFQNPLQVSFAVPSNAAGGYHRMRILMLDHATTYGCENYLNGETEDYEIFVYPGCQAPQNASVSNITATSAKLSWTDPNGVGNYEVQYAESGTANWTSIPVNGQTFTSLPGLASGTMYVVKVKRVCPPSNSSPWTSDVSFTTVCPIPLNLSLSNITSTTALVSWTDSNGTGNYEVQYIESGAVNWTSVPVNGQMSTLISGLTSGTMYVVKVKRICSPSSASSWTTDVSFTTVCPIPQNLSVSNITLTTALVSWTDPNGPGNYEVQYAESVSENWTSIPVNGQTSVPLSGLTPGTTYVVKVKRICSPATTSAWTSDVWFTTLCPVPQNLSFSNITSTTALVSWTDPFGTGNYEVQYSIAGSANWATISVNAQTSTPLSGLVPGTTYAVKVKRVCSAASSSAWTSDGYLIPVCPAPTTVSIGNITSTSATIGWNDAAGTGDYRIAYRVYGTVPWQYVLVNGSTSGPLNGLTQATTYEVMVSRVCPAYSSNWTSVNTFTTLCPAPSNLLLTKLTAYQATLTWTGAAGVTTYRVWYHIAGGAWTNFQTNTTQTTLWVQSGSMYEVYVQSVCGTQSSAYANMVSFTVPAYCASKGNSTQYEWIDYVALGTLQNSTGSNGGYGNYTNLNAPEISQGQSYTINLSAGGSAFFRNKYWRVWIDFNQDGDFNDAGEQVASTNSTSYGTLSASILVPGGGPLGYTRMRVSMKYGAYASTCETFSNGEVEDYLVNIADPNGGVIGRGRTTTEATAAVEGTPASEIEIYPNPVRNVLNISGADATSLIQIKNALGQELYKGALREQLDVESWAAGVYLLQIRSGKEVRLIRFVKE